MSWEYHVIFASSSQLYLGLIYQSHASASEASCSSRSGLVSLDKKSSFIYLPFSTQNISTGFQWMLLFNRTIRNKPRSSLRSPVPKCGSNLQRSGSRLLVLLLLMRLFESLSLISLILIVVSRRLRIHCLSPLCDHRGFGGGQPWQHFDRRFVV